MTLRDHKVYIEYNYIIRFEGRSRWGHDKAKQESRFSGSMRRDNKTASGGHQHEADHRHERKGHSRFSQPSAPPSGGYENYSRGRGGNMNSGKFGNQSQGRQEFKQPLMHDNKSQSESNVPSLLNMSVGRPSQSNPAPPGGQQQNHASHQHSHTGRFDQNGPVRSEEHHSYRQPSQRGAESQGPQHQMSGQHRGQGHHSQNQQMQGHHRGQSSDGHHHQVSAQHGNHRNDSNHQMSDTQGNRNNNAGPNYPPPPPSPLSANKTTPPPGGSSSENMSNLQTMAYYYSQWMQQGQAAASSSPQKPTTAAFSAPPPPPPLPNNPPPPPSQDKPHSGYSGYQYQ